jgi:PAS domain S-box-containing protein
VPEAGRRALVLNVDDDEAGRYAKTRALRRAEDIEVIEAATGGNALRLVAERRPALVLLDVKLPDINGLEVCRLIKRDRPETLVLQISASFISGGDRTRGLDAGADAYLTQPVEPSELVASVRALLRIREAEARLRASEERLRLVVDGARDHAIITTDGEGRVTGWSSGAEAIFGWSAAEAVGQETDLIFTPEDRAAGAPRQELETARHEGCANDERWHLRKDGGRVFMNGSVRPLHDAEGREAGFLKVARDETERRGTHEAAARLAAIVSATPDAIVSFSGEDGLIASWNKGAERLFGYTEAEAIGAPVSLLLPPPDRVTSSEDGTGVFRWAMRDGAVQVESVRRRKDGSLIDVAISAARTEALDGRALGVSAIFRDMTERKRAEEALRASEANFRTLADNIPTLCWMANADGWIYWYNRRWHEYTGTTPDQMEGWGWQSVHDPLVLPAVMERWTGSIASGNPFDMVFPLKGADGAFRPFLTRIAPVRDGDGRILRWFGTNTDISEQRAAEDRLRELNETLEQRVQAEVARHAETEERLRQSQKMEAVGQLTGGVAHDFNNLLQIVTGNLEILGRNLPEDAGRLRRATDNAMNGAKRAATLTQRLLAFSRRQPLAPKALSANQLVSGMSDLLNRALGETVALETVLAAGLWRVEADSNQLENAILNLAVNARDAMAGGGKLTIETANAHLDEAYAHNNAEVSPGQYVVVCVSDTGTGMDAETRARAFEPFFTTKEVGKGTGLGLSQVYGFVKQSGGHVAIYSEPGEGTTVKIYLPRLLGAMVEELKPDEPAAPEGSWAETVLVVEDDHDVRAYTVEVLRELGYRVLEAHDGATASRLLERQDTGRIDLLFTDVVLPGGMNGEQVAARARDLRPGLKVLFTTGYARNAIVHHGRLDPGVRLVTKPFTFADLAAKVRDLLDTRAP